MKFRSFLCLLFWGSAAGLSAGSPGLLVSADRIGPAEALEVRVRSFPEDFGESSPAVPEGFLFSPDRSWRIEPQEAGRWLCWPESADPGPLEDLNGGIYHVTLDLPESSGVASLRPPKSRSWCPWIIGGLVFLGGAGVGVVFWYGRRRPDESEAQELFLEYLALRTLLSGDSAGPEAAVRIVRRSLGLWAGCPPGGLTFTDQRAVLDERRFPRDLRPPLETLWAYAEASYLPEGSGESPAVRPDRIVLDLLGPLIRLRDLQEGYDEL